MTAADMTMKRRTFLTTTAGVATPLLAGCIGGNGGGGDVVDTTEVSMVNGQFNRQNIHIDAGATVTWTNEDSRSRRVA